MKLQELLDLSIDTIVSNPAYFNELVYTKASEAIIAIRKRRYDTHTLNAAKDYIENVPPPLIKSPRVVLSRHLVTPNYEFRRFISIADLLDFEPLFLEYIDDKFTSKNQTKYCLGKLPFNVSLDRHGHPRLEYDTIIDFNSSDGNAISSIKTEFGASLVDFHHSFMDHEFPAQKDCRFDASRWLHGNGGVAKYYYYNHLSLFLVHGILIDNFVLGNKNELSLIKNVFLPAFIQIIKDTKLKPLIVALMPTEIEDSIFWLSYPYATREFIQDFRLNHLTKYGV